ncbi:MAG: archease [Acidobacteria bacterium]|nr:archease [Acidobacteriota bacterium]
MRGFRVFGTTADIGIHARGATLANLFDNAALGMYHLMGSPDPAAPRRAKKLAVSAGSEELLLFRWLSELLYLYDGKAMFGCGLANTTIVDNRITSQLVWIPGDRVKLRHQLKAVTMHRLAIQRSPDGFRAAIIFDV